MRAYMNDKRRGLAREFSAPRAGDAGYDLHAIDDFTVATMQRIAVRTGLHLEIPAGYVGLVKDRSSVAAAGMHCLAGVIDSSYRGELRVLMINLNSEAMQIKGWPEDSATHHRACPDRSDRARDRIRASFAQRTR